MSPPSSSSLSSSSLSSSSLSSTMSTVVFVADREREQQAGSYRKQAWSNNNTFLPSSSPNHTASSSLPLATRTTTKLMPNAFDGNKHVGRGSPPGESSTSLLNGRTSPPLNHPTGLTLTSALIKAAVERSSDDGATLDFSNRSLAVIGESGADELAQVGRGDDEFDECCILRIALVGNRLSTLPATFAGLSRLRYLTLRSNAFTVFPEVLTDMPSLEILDFSRNRIRRLPSDPGSLVKLRVLSISRNKLHKLPSYLYKFRHLTVLKVDRNPVEWPPASVMDTGVDLEDPESMHNWVVGLKSWLEENTSPEPTEVRGLDQTETAQNTPLPALPNPREIWAQAVKNQEGDNDAGVTPHARSFSIDSENSTYTTSSAASIENDRPEKPPALDFDSVSSTTTGTSYSPGSYLPTPDDSLTSAEDDPTRGFHELQLSRDRLHGRNKSYAYERASRDRKGTLAPQKSLPNLRSPRAHSSEKKVHHSQTRNVETTVQPQKSGDGFSGSPVEAFRPGPPPPPTPPTYTPPLQTRKTYQTTRPDQTAGPSTERRAPSMDVERNSYFRRLSALPVASISRVIPPALLSLVDSIRGILFAVSQIYQSLQHYTVYAIDERLSSVLQKVLDPASRYMLQLIDALDAFDSMSRRGPPPPSVCRRVVEACRDNVSVFGKAVGVLALQLKVLASRDDVRYSRQMLLMLYGAMAEISNSWQGIAHQMDAVEPLLRGEERPPLPLKLSILGNGAAKIPMVPQRTDSRERISPIAEQPESPSPFYSPAFVSRSAPSASKAGGSVLPLSTSGKVPVGGERSRMARRHAGSFSVKDVEMGRSMASNYNVSPPADRLASGSNVPLPRQLTRHVQPSMPPVPHPFPHSTPGHSPTKSALGQSSDALHVRQDSSQGMLPLGSPSPGLRSNMLDVPSNSTTLVDKDAIEAMAVAVRAAPAVWTMLDEISRDMPDAAIDLQENLTKADVVTNRLGENIKAIKEGLPSADRKALREDAHVFVRTVIQLSSVAKDYGAAHRLHAQLWKDIAKLTNATQEFVTLLHVSSYSPSSTPRPYTPLLSNSGAAAQASVLNSLAAAESGKQGASLSRSRSAQPAASLKVTPPIVSAIPRSALPNQSFRIPPTPSRMGSRMRSGDDSIAEVP